MNAENLGTQFSPRKTKDRTFCSVYGCSSRAKVNTTVRFHTFPTFGKHFVTKPNIFGGYEKADRAKMWMDILKLPKERITRNTMVCSLHFRREDHIFPDVSTGKRYLKTTAILSCNLPTHQKRKHDEGDEYDSRKEKKMKREIRLNARNHRIGLHQGKGTNEEYKELRINDNDKSADQNFQDINNEDQVPMNETCPVPNREFVSIATQVKSGDIIFKLSDLITSDKELNTMTGVSNFQMLQRIVDSVQIVYPETRKSNIDTRDKIIMTLMKLKHNMTYSILAVFFKCVKISQCRKIIHNTLTKLSNVLKYAIPFPSMEEISRNMPTCFEDFPNVRIVLDCTEIFIQEPKKLCCQIGTYSRYKSHYTVKVMTGVTPAGVISFVSKPYGGRCSDNTIFEQSKIIERLDKKEAVMVDKGFTIDELCLKYGVKLIRPPFLREKAQFSKEEALSNAKIAKARVHVERSNARLKLFKILSGKMPIGLVPKAEEIFIIISAIVNMSSPILSDNRF